MGLDIDTAPNTLGNIIIHYSGEKVLWQLRGEYVGSYFTDAENQHSYPGHLLLHFKSTYQWNSDIELGLRLSNLTDKRYASRADYSSFGGDRYFPGQPMNLQLSIAYQY